jgi:hypothetical protein
VRTLYATQFADLDSEDIESLVTLTMALADGLFVAQETGEVELRGAFDLLATAVVATAEHLRADHRAGAKQRHERSRRPGRR